VGVIVGTYSTVYIATPVLLWLAGTDGPGAKAISPRAAA
jgi:preprotein translocase subunit SecF